MTATTPLSLEQHPLAPLCPSCHNPVVRIDTSVEIKYRVHYVVTAQDLEVIEEQVGESDWDENTPASCDTCGWHGSVGELMVKR